MTSLNLLGSLKNSLSIPRLPSAASYMKRFGFCSSPIVSTAISLVSTWKTFSIALLRAYCRVMTPSLSSPSTGVGKMYRAFAVVLVNS